MPRVSDAHLAARRQQILAAARTRFSRNGFHATSMQDVIAEAGLSVGAVYRYFKSKEDLILAIATEVLDAVSDAMAGLVAHDPPLRPDQSLDRLASRLESELGPDGAFRLALQVWSESLRNPHLAEFIRQTYPVLRGHLTDLAQRAQRAGSLAPDADPVAVGATMLCLLTGYLTQHLLTGVPDRAMLAEGMRGLLVSGLRGRSGSGSPAQPRSAAQLA